MVRLSELANATTAVNDTEQLKRLAEDAGEIETPHTRGGLRRPRAQI